MLKNRRLWRVLTSIFAFLIVVAFCGTSVVMANFDNICASLGTPASAIVEDENAEEIDTEYYKSEYGELSDANLEKLRADAYAQVEEEAAEGTVLLTNNGALPLENEERSVSLFGRATADPLYVGGGAVATSYQDPDITVDLREGLENAGFSVNETLYSAYAGSNLSRTNGNPGECPASFYTDAVKDSWENEYNDVAIIMLARYGGEGSDMKTSVLDDDGTTSISSLSLYKNERDLLQMVKEEKDAGTFDKVILLVNSPWQLELYWLEEYGIDACLWIGTPGVTGFNSIAKILTGEINPSGRSVDTFAVSSLSSPAVVNAIDNTPQWANAAEVQEKVWYGGDVINNNNTPEQILRVMVQQENIYIGYKYYETRYEDYILGRGNANGTNGALYGADEWNYADEVSFPFGYGLSYTEFSRTIESVNYNAETDTYTVKVIVENIGNTAGKTSVPIYVQTPYGEYERENSVEKSAILLVGFDKTQSLEPGATETLEVEIDRYLLASYDDNAAKGYIISEGDYYFAVGDSAHDALNNILEAKGADGLIDIGGVAVEGDTNQVFSFQEEFDAESYRYGENGYEVTNQFDKNDIKYWDTTDITYLSRSDWNGTYPLEPAAVVCTEEMMAELVQDPYEMPEDAPDVTEFHQGVDSGITFVMMKDIAYDNDAVWDQYLDQFTLEELAMNLTDFSGCQEQPSVARPATYVSDGIIGPRGTYLYGDGDQPCVYTGQGILSATFNKDIIENRAKMLSEEALYVGHNENWGLGGDLHRTPFGGRNWEYCSEDANLTALVTEILTVEMLDRGFMPSIKHFTGNDQESYRNGVSTFYTEQSFRENSLRGFEGCLRWGGSMGTMASMARQGMTYTPACVALMTNVLRGEWGFTGHVISDMCARQTFMQGFLSQIAAQTDNFCGTGMLKDPVTGLSTPGYQVIEAIENGDGYMLQCLRRAVKNYTYSMVHSNLVNGLSSNSRIVSINPWWETALYIFEGVSCGLTAISLGLLVISEVLCKKSVSTKESA